MVTECSQSGGSFGNQLLQLCLLWEEKKWQGLTSSSPKHRLSALTPRPGQRAFLKTPLLQRSAVRAISGPGQSALAQLGRQGRRVAPMQLHPLWCRPCQRQKEEPSPPSSSGLQRLAWGEEARSTMAPFPPPPKLLGSGFAACASGEAGKQSLR